MNVVFYNNSSDKRTLNKSITQIKNIETLNIKTPTSIINPVFTVNVFDNFVNVNYVYIPTYNRYYFITDIIQITNNILELHCSVDVLMSYKTQLLNSKAIIQTSNNINKYIIDSDIKFLNYKDFELLNFPNSFASELTYVLTVSGGGTSGS